MTPTPNLKEAVEQIRAITQECGQTNGRPINGGDLEFLDDLADALEALSALPPVVEAPGDQEGELIKRLRARPGADHERGCDGRNYECTCGYNDANDSLFIEAADALSSPEPGGSEFVPIPLSDEVVSYVARYGGMCRDCADEAGVCPNSGLPCDDDGDKAIRHVIKALNYGFGKGYLKFPEASQGSVAATRPEVAP